MKGKLSSLVLVAVFLLGGLVTSVHADPYATLDLIGGNITVGGSFDVAVWGHADGTTALDPSDIQDVWLAFAFEVDSVSTVFSWDGYSIGSYFDDDTTYFPVNYVAGSVFPGIADEDVMLATLHFTALETGTGSLSVFGDSSVYEGMVFWLAGFYDIDASIDITVNAASIPEPAALLLIASGLVGLAGFRKRFRKS